MWIIEAMFVGDTGPVRLSLQRYCVYVFRKHRYTAHRCRALLRQISTDKVNNNDEVLS